MDEEAPKGIHVIIMGSIAGLTLANCLRRKDIRFTVLESGSEIAVSRGASIGLRILDQLGMFEELSQVMTPVHVSSLWTETGRLIKKGYPRILQERYMPPSSITLKGGLMLLSL
jgi:2-polyprenyl-6-methoxyphenol hydroxylase-like FAD-dependent oxidoreductase